MSAPARAEAFVLAWARRYTRGLPPDAGQRRRLELASDCFEQRRRGREVGAHPRAVATSMVVRTLAGVPADLAWRHQALAARRGRPLSEGGRPMGRWIKDNWWVVLGGLNATLTTVLGIGLPFEDRTLGSVIGGIVIAALGLSALAGIYVRRQPGRRAAGDLMIAGGQLPWLPFFWAVVPPIIALVVIIAAFIDLSDASATGHDSRRTSGDGGGVGRVSIALMATLVAALVVAVVHGSSQVALGLVLPLAVALLVHLVATRRLAGRPALHAGVVLLFTPLLSLVAAGLIWLYEDGYVLTRPWSAISEVVGLVMLVSGLVLVIGGLRQGRQARPA